MTRRARLAVFVGVLCLLSCKAKPEKLLIGKWSKDAEASASSVEFLANGTAIRTTANGKREVTYQFINGRSIEISEPKNKVTLEWTVESLTKDELVQVMNTSRQTLRRVK